MYSLEKVDSRASNNIYNWIERREHQAVSFVYIFHFLAYRE